MKISLYNIQKGIRYLKHYGWREFWIRLKEKSEPEVISYKDWYAGHCATEEQLKSQKKKAAAWKGAPKISILVASGGREEQSFPAAVESVKRQSYANWELCVADDYDAAFARATGAYMALLDPEGMLTPDALYEVAAAILKEQPELLYTDEDRATEPQLKPDFNPDLLRSCNYIGHLVVAKSELVRRVGGFGSTFAGATEYDFILRATEQAAGIVHIPKVLYRSEKSTNCAKEEILAVQAHLDRLQIPASVEGFDDPAKAGFYRVRYERTGNPLVSIIIPNKDEAETLDRCLSSVFRSTYPNYEVIIVENNSQNPETFAYYRKVTKEHPQVFVQTWDKGTEFNYSAINNFGIASARGEYLVLLNNDIELITEGWLEEMLGNCMRPEIAVVGARLYYPDDTIQHAGIVVGIGGHARGIASNMLVGTKRTEEGYLHRAGIQMDYSAVTAACMMVKTSVFREVGGFTEKLAVAFNDVDLCLKIRKAGYLVVYDPFVEAYHYESKSRGQEDSEEKIRRFQTEIEYMRTEWNEIMRNGDPYYNPNLSRVKNDYSLKGN